MNRTAPLACPRALTIGTAFAGAVFALASLGGTAFAEPGGSIPLPVGAVDQAQQAQTNATDPGPLVLTDAELDDVTAGFLSAFRLNLSSINSSIRSTARSVGASMPSSCAVGDGIVFGNCSSH